MVEIKMSPSLAELIRRHCVDPDEHAALYADIYRLGQEEASAAQRLDADQTKRFGEWRKEQDRKVYETQQAAGMPNARGGRPNYGAIGGAYVWTYCHTSLGTVVKVTNEVTGDELDLTDYSW